MTALRDTSLLRRELVGLSDSELRRRKHAAQREAAEIDRMLKQRRERRKREEMQAVRMRAPVR